MISRTVCFLASFLMFPLYLSCERTINPVFSTAIQFKYASLDSGNVWVYACFDSGWTIGNCQLTRKNYIRTIKIIDRQETNNGMAFTAEFSDSGIFDTMARFPDFKKSYAINTTWLLHFRTNGKTIFFDDVGKSPLNWYPWTDSSGGDFCNIRSRFLLNVAQNKCLDFQSIPTHIDLGIQCVASERAHYKYAGETGLLLHTDTVDFLNDWSRRASFRLLSFNGVPADTFNCNL